MKTGTPSIRQPLWNSNGNPEYNPTILGGWLDPDQGANMGAIRVKVQLSNAIDEGLVRRGQLAPDQVRTCEADALGSV